MTSLHVLRVFTGADGSFGNPLGVFLDGPAVPEAARQSVAADLGLSETVFVDDAASGTVRIFTPALELDFAGHPLVGTIWLLARERSEVPALHPPAGPVPARVEGDRAFVAGRPEWGPEHEWIEVGSPDEVMALDGPPAGHELAAMYAWSGEDEVRARVFPVGLGIAEDEATGSAAVRLGVLLGRPLTITQGRGSVIEVVPRDDGHVEVGGSVVLDEVRDYDAG